MTDKQSVLALIKKTVAETEPTASVILYGSYARGDYRDDSDIDILVLLDSDNEKLSRSEKDRIALPIYYLSVAIDTVISPNIYSRKAWASHRVTPYFENVNREGIPL